jgi:hypothetical protein
VENQTGTGPATPSETAVIDSLARELVLPFEQVERAFNEEARKIEATARIKTFVGVIVASRVRAELRQQQRATARDH